MDPEETDFTRKRLEGACGHFLGFTPVFLGAVRQDPGLPAAVMEQIPLLEASPESPASKDITAIAENLFRQKKNILSGAGTPFLTEEECGNPSAED